MEQVAAKFHIPSDARTWAEIDLSALRHNVAVAREKIGPGHQVMAVVKADAYGPGVIPVVRALEDVVDSFGVANVEEAQEIVSHVPEKEILLLSTSLAAERRAAVEEGFVSSISTVEEAEAYSREAGTKPALLNLKIDTGMGRMGCWQDEAAEMLGRIVKLPGIEVRHLSTHLPVADEDEAFTEEQLVRFESLCQDLLTLAPGARLHALNSGGILGFPRHAGQIARAGLMLYGSAYPADHQPLLQPALTWKARIILMRDVAAGRSVSYGRTFVTPQAMRIATVPVGYADGFPRQASGQGAEVLVGGRRCAVLGRVTMDQILVDVSAVPETAIGDEVVIVGRQGDDEIFAKELADKAGTIAWDIFTGLKKRVARFYA